MPLIMEGTKPINNNMEGTRPPTGASPTQPFNAVKMLKSTPTPHRQEAGDLLPPDFDWRGDYARFTFDIVYSVSRAV
jgi:hypothetical protein